MRVVEDILLSERDGEGKSRGSNRALYPLGCRSERVAKWPKIKCSFSQKHQEIGPFNNGN